MAPKRKRDEASTSATRMTRSAAASSATKATRSATRRGDAVLEPPMDNPEPRKGKKAKTVIIEHDSFNRKANQVKNRLKRALPGLNVVLNPEEPRNGCFEIRGEEGEIFVSLLDMQSPFAPLQALNINAVVADIVQRLN